MQTRCLLFFFKFIIAVYILWMCFHTGAVWAQSSWMERHPLALSAATGSLSSSVLFLLKDWFFAEKDWNIPSNLNIPANLIPDTSELTCPETPRDIPLNFWSGLIVGLLLWPLLEVLVLIKQWATLSIKARIARLTGVGRSPKLYRVIS